MAKGRRRIKVPLFYKLAETTNAMFIALWIGKIEIFMLHVHGFPRCDICIVVLIDMRMVI